MHYYRRRSGGDGVPLWVAFTAVAATAGVIFAATYENPADRARKPEVIERMLEDSHAVCAQTKNYELASYDERFRSTLEEAYTADLETLEDAGITICLDERLQEQQDLKSLWDSAIAGVYYPEYRVLTILDEGASYNSFFADRHVVGEGVPAKFAKDLRDDGHISKEFSIIVRAKSPYVAQRSESRVSSELAAAPYLHTAPVARP